MTIDELTIKLKEKRIEREITLKSMTRIGVSYDQIHYIESGKNYKFDSFFKYLEASTMLLKVNGQVVENIVQFGDLLKDYRINRNILIRDMSYQAKIGTQQINNIEYGRNYTKSTLMKYLSVINIDFDFVSMMEYF